MSKFFTKMVTVFIIVLGIMLVIEPLYANSVIYETNIKNFFKEIRGKVTDESGVGIPGVSVTVKGTKKVAVTDNSGNFKIDAQQGDILIFSYIGFTVQEVTVNTQDTININLKESNSDLQQVVVIGYGQQKKISVTAAISTVSAKELKQSPVSNLNNALVGRLPGLIGLQTSGDPGRDAAALLIRGRGTYNNSSPLILVDGVERSFSTIDPNEVENISILKDASATAVYGVRGANGVILVTTRRGTVAPPQVSVTANSAIQQPTRLPNFLDSYNYSLLLNEAYVNEGKAPLYSQTELDGYKNRTDPYLYPDVNYFEEFLKKNALQYTINANVSGGTKLAKYFVSGSYFSQDGIFKRTNGPDFNADLNYNRYNFRSNVDLDVTNNLRIAINLSARAETRKGPVNSTSTLFGELMAFPPNSAPLLNPDGTYGYNWRQNNVLAEFESHGFTKDYNNKLDGSAIIDYKLSHLIKGLSAKANVSFTNEYQHSVSRFRGSQGGVNDWYARYKIIGKNPDGSYQYSEMAGTFAPIFNFSQAFDGANTRTTYVEASLNYTNTFGKNTITALLLANRNRRTRNSSAFDWPFSYQGLVSRVTYNYNDKYLAEVNLGYNGSENFPSDKRYGLFPSFSLGWVASNEEFLKNVKAIDVIKIRASYGQVGNDRFGSDEFNPSSRFLFFQNSYATGTGYSFGLTNNNTVAGYVEGSFGNPIITWEKANKYNIGLETSFLKNKLGLNVDVFYEKRNSILTQPATIPATVGQTLQVVNLGIVENKGYEVELSHRNQINSFGYTIKANLAYAKNTRLFIDEPDARYPWMRRTGTSIDQTWGYQTAGFFNNQAEIDAWPKTSFDPGPLGKLQPGDFKYIDQNKDGLIDIYDQVAIGNPRNPLYTYGGTLGIDFKNFDLSVLLQGTSKTSMVRTLEAGYEFFNKAKVMDIHQGRWTPATAATATYPRLSSSPTATQHNYQSSDFWTIDASYLRIKSAEIGYTLPKSWIQKIGLKSARIYSNGANLFTWDKVKYLDPENRDLRAWYYPQQRIFNFGANITF